MNHTTLEDMEKSFGFNRIIEMYNYAVHTTV